MESSKVGFEIRTLSNLLKRKIHEEYPAPEEERLTDMQGEIIDFLFEHRNVRDVYQKDVEMRFSIRRSTASRFLQSLEQKGFINRVPVPEDARLKKLILTPKAVTGHNGIKEKIKVIENQATKGLTQEELSSFFSIIDKIKSNLG